MKETLLDIISQHSQCYKLSTAFQLSLRYMIDNCNDEKRVISVLVEEIKEMSDDCLEEFLSEEEIEEIKKIIG